ncbi:MAG: hypothetical protein ACRC6X_02970 [Culicoidibacterales bacterium]
MLIEQSILLMIKRPWTTLLLVIQLIIICFQMSGCYLMIETIQTKEQILASLTKKDETIINVQAIQSREEIDGRTRRDTNQIEQLFEKEKIVANKFYLTGGKLAKADYPPIPTLTKNYEYIQNKSELEALIVSEPLKGEFIFTEGENFHESDFEEGPAPVILGEAFRFVHKLGDVFEIDMSTGGGIGKVQLKVKGFLKEKTLQPILTNFLAYSTENFNNYFIIGMQKQEHPLFYAPSYNIQVSDMQYQSLQPLIYELNESRYAISDEFSHKKKERSVFVQQINVLITQLVFYLFIVIMTYYILAFQIWRNQESEYLIFKLIGGTMKFAKSCFIGYFVGIWSTAIIIWQGIALFNDNSHNGMITIATITLGMTVSLLLVLVKKRIN